MKKQTKNLMGQNGITLIALVITIIILIILAGVLINLTLGNNGIFTRTKNAKEKYEESQVREKVGVMLAEYSVEKNIDGKELTTYLDEQKQKGTIEDYTDNGDNTITINVDGYEVIVNKESLEIIDVSKSGASVKITLSKNEADVNEQVTAQVEFGDGVNFSECKWEFSKEAALGTTASSYTNTFTGKANEINLQANTKGVYFLHILLVDNKGNTVEKISQEVIVGTFTITYNSNGGSGTMTATTASRPQVAENTYTAPTGKMFKEWNTQSDGNGNKYEVGKVIYEDINLYAIWEEQKIRLSDLKNMNDTQTISHYGELTDFTSVEGVKWQLFLHDDSNVYLIASDYVPTTLLPTGDATSGNLCATPRYKNPNITYAGYTAYFGSDEGYFNEIYEDYVFNGAGNNPATDAYKDGSASSAITGNPLTTTYLKWAEIKNSSTNANIKATAFMMDTGKWSSFAGSNYTSAFAIGGPTVEMFVKSYNAKHDTKLASYYDSEGQLLIESYNDNGYKVKWAADVKWSVDRVDVPETTNAIGDSKGNMWVRNTCEKAYGYFLASPSALSGDSLNVVTSGGLLNSNGVCNCDFGFRPVVCIPKSSI